MLMFWTLALAESVSQGGTHSLETGLITVDTRTTEEVLYTPLPDPDPLTAEPVNEAKLASPRHDQGAGTTTFEVEMPSAGTRVRIKKSTDLVSDQTIGEFHAEGQRTLVTDQNATGDRAFYWAEYIETHPGEIGFIDDFCTKADPSGEQDPGGDSDNYFLRSNDDHQNLEIHYKLPTDLNITDVRFIVYEGDDSSVPLKLGILGAMDDNDAFKTGVQRVEWNAPFYLTQERPGFYRIQMRVYVNGETEQCWRSPIEDANRDASDGWQCPHGCLAVFDPVHRHRPILHLGKAVGGLEYPIDPLVFLDESELWNQDSENGKRLVIENPTIADLANYNADSYFLNVPGEGVTAAPNYSGRLVPTTVMFSVNDHDSRGNVNNEEYLFLQYWMFYDFSNSFLDFLLTPFHEGDVEYVQVAVKLFGRDWPLLKDYWMRPFGATASQHYYGQTLGWDRLDGSAKDRATIRTVEHTNGRPHVYVAQGTHATYFAEATFKTDLLRQHLDTALPIQWENFPIGAGAYETTVRGARSYTLIRCPEIFLSWRGRWGWVGSVDGTDWQDGPPGTALRSANYKTGDFSVNLRFPVEFHNACIRSEQLDELAIPQ